MKSPKETALDKKILRILSGKALSAVEYMINDDEIKHLQDYANTVSIKRLQYNDHGPVHMRKVALNAVIMSGLLRDSGIRFSLEEESAGSYDDSLTAILTAAFLHDIGMTVGRQEHEKLAVIIGTPIIDRIMRHVYPESLERAVIGRSLAIECISGHMGSHSIHSLEAGVLLIADGLDMEKGRARIPMLMESESKVGDIHKYSATAIEKVTISAGESKPVRISVRMSESVGFYQIEEVLFPKINSSTMKPYIELVAAVKGGDEKKYL